MLEPLYILVWIWIYGIIEMPLHMALAMSLICFLAMGGGEWIEVSKTRRVNKRRAASYRKEHL